MRTEVPADELERIVGFQEDIENLDKIIDVPKDRPIAFGLVQEKIINPEFPYELKMDHLKYGLFLIRDYGADESNEDVAEMLIESIRGSKDPGLRIRMTAILSSEIKLENINRVGKSADMTEIVNIVKRREAFELLTRDPDVPVPVKKWAEIILNPRGEILVFNKLYEKDPDTFYLPRVEEKIVDIEDTEREDPIEKPEGDLIWEIIRLFPPRIYSPKKGELYHELFGHMPPINITRELGGKYIHIKMPLKYADEIALAVDDFRNERISRKTVWKEVGRYFNEFLEKLHGEQKEEILDAIKNGNFSLRFESLRPRYLKEQQDREEEIENDDDIENLEEIAEGKTN